MRTFFSLSHCFSIHVLYAYMYCIHTLHPPSTICVHCALYSSSYCPTKGSWFWRVRSRVLKNLVVSWVGIPHRLPAPENQVSSRRTWQFHAFESNLWQSSFPGAAYKAWEDLPRWEVQVPNLYDTLSRRFSSCLYWSHGLLRIMWSGEHWLDFSSCWSWMSWPRIEFCVVSSPCRCAPPKHPWGRKSPKLCRGMLGALRWFGAWRFSCTSTWPVASLVASTAAQWAPNVLGNCLKSITRIGPWVLSGQFPEGLKNAMFCWSKTGEPFEKVFPSRGSGRNFPFFTGTQNPSSVFHSSQTWLGCASQWFGCSPVASEIPPLCRTSDGLPKCFRSSMD